MTSILKFLLLAMALVVGISAFAVAGPRATHQQAQQSLADQSSGYQPVSPPPWAW
jgi:hypothetical protein